MDPRFTQLPVEGPITGHFGDDYAGYRHRGVDFGVPVGTPVRAPAAGRVVGFSNDGSFGIGVCLDHETMPWRFTLYAHLLSRAVGEGQSVQAGDLLGYSGNTGASTGPHLHWQLCDSTWFPMDIGHSADPLAYYHQEEEMTPEERELLRSVAAALTGMGDPTGAQIKLAQFNGQGNSLIDGEKIMWNNLYRHLNAQDGLHDRPVWTQY